jgi:hypothetical protein
MDSAQLMKTVESILGDMRAVEIKSADDYMAGADFLKKIKATGKLVEEAFEPEKKALYAPYKAKLEEIKRYTSVLDQAEAIVKEKLTAYKVLADAQARKAAADRLAEFRAEAEALGIDPDSLDAPDFAASAGPNLEVKGLSYREEVVVDVEASDPALIPDQFKTVDWSAVAAAVKAGTPVPGVKTKVRRIAVARSA